MLAGRTARLQIEPMAHGHAAALVAALSDPDVSTYLLEPAATTVEAMHARIDHLARGPASAGERWLNFVMRRDEDGVVIGRLEATVYGAWAEIAYLVGAAYQRRGFAREGVRWLADNLAAAGVAELWACVHPANVASLRLLAALDFVAGDPAARPLASYAVGDRVLTLSPRSPRA